MITALIDGASLSCGVLALLVLAEVGRVPALSDVVVVGAAAREQRVGADGLGRRLHQRAHHDAVVVGAGRVEHQLLERRVVQVGQLQQLEVRRVAEDASTSGVSASTSIGQQERRGQASANTASTSASLPRSPCPAASWMKSTSPKPTAPVAKPARKMPARSFARPMRCAPPPSRSPGRRARSDSELPSSTPGQRREDDGEEERVRLREHEAHQHRPAPPPGRRSAAPRSAAQG